MRMTSNINAVFNHQSSTTSQDKKPTKNIGDLPLELLHKIMTYSQPYDVWHLSKTNYVMQSAAKTLLLSHIKTLNTKDPYGHNLFIIPSSRVQLVPTYLKCEQIIKQSRASADVLRLIAARDDHFLNCVIARHPNCPIDVLRQFATGNHLLKCIVVRLSNCPSDVLRQFAEGDKPCLQKLAAQHPNTPVDVTH